jgi:hypothetical protein
VNQDDLQQKKVEQQERQKAIEAAKLLLRSIPQSSGYRKERTNPLPQQQIHKKQGKKPIKKVVNKKNYIRKI